MQQVSVTFAKRHGRLLALALVLLLASVATWWATLRGPAEPVYQGKTATEWILAYGAATYPREIWLPKPGSSFTNSSPMRGLRFVTTNAPAILLFKNSRGEQIRQMFPPPIDTNEMVRKIIMTSHPPDRDPALAAIREIGPPALPYLAEALNKKEPTLRTWQRKYWPGCPRYIRTNLFSNTLRLADYHRNSILILGYLGTNAVPAIPALERARQSKEVFVRDRAVEILQKLDAQGRSKAEERKN